MKRMRHTWNVFKNEVKNMSIAERKDLLKDLHSQLMSSYVRRHADMDKSRCWILRRKIAFLKTVLNYKGFSYNLKG